jgi:iron-sulfur cluster repair protein YtfE (RIC family)
MARIAEVLAGHHAHCDELFGATESAVAGGDRGAAREAYARFREETERHLACEERRLFPALEAATGSSAGPTAVMRAEHDLMRELFAHIAAALDGGDAAGYEQAVTTLVILMGQHNNKEENILYPMCDRLLMADAGDLVQALRAELGTPCPC